MYLAAPRLYLVAEILVPACASSAAWAQSQIAERISDEDAQFDPANPRRRDAVELRPGTTKPRPARTGLLRLSAIFPAPIAGALNLLYAFEILPLLMQLAHTRRRFGLPFTSALTACRFTFQRRFVTLCACEMLLPNCGPLPQTSHTCAISICSRLVFSFPRQLEPPKAALIRPDPCTSALGRAKGRMKTHPPFSLPNL